MRHVDPVEELLHDWAEYCRTWKETQGNLQRIARAEMGRMPGMPGAYGDPVFANHVAEENLRIGFFAAVDLVIRGYPRIWFMMLVGRYVGQQMEREDGRPCWRPYTWAEIERGLDMTPTTRKATMQAVKVQLFQDARSVARRSGAKQLGDAKETHFYLHQIEGGCTPVAVGLS